VARGQVIHNLAALGLNGPLRAVVNNFGIRIRRGGTVRCVCGNTSGGIGRTTKQVTENVTGEILSPGERTQVRAGNNTYFKRTHKLIVALTVQEILEEQIAKKLV
jgi:hypothetical protein